MPFRSIIFDDLSEIGGGLTSSSPPKLRAAPAIPPTGLFCRFESDFGSFVVDLPGLLTASAICFKSSSSTSTFFRKLFAFVGFLKEKLISVSDYALLNRSKCR